MHSTRIGIKIPLIALVLVLWLSSCRTTRNLPTVVAKPISTNKLLKKVEQNAFDFTNFSIKRINCQFSSNKTKANFKINLKALWNEKILVSISKINIPVGKVLLTPDSVKYVNYIDRNYFIDDYSFVSNFLNIDLDFKTIQSILSNNVFSYRNDRDLKSFESFIESGFYILQSEKERKIFKMEKRKKIGKKERRLKRFDEKALILQKMYFKPENFALAKLVINDKTNHRTMEMDFDDFTRIKNRDYPGTITMNFVSPVNKVNLHVRMVGFSTDTISAFNFNIPGKYEKIVVN